MKYKLRIKTPNELGYLENLKSPDGMTFSPLMYKFCGLVLYSKYTWITSANLCMYYEIESFSFAPEWVKVLGIYEI